MTAQQLIAPLRRLARRIRDTSARTPYLAAGLMVASCQGSLTTDLATAPPADSGLLQITAPLRGVELRKSDDTTETIEFRSAERVNLIEYGSGEPLRLLTSEQLTPGTYTGMRLLFDVDAAADSVVVDDRDREYDLTVNEGEFTAVDFTVAEDESARESWTLTLDLRQSLINAGDHYALTPVLRAAATGDSGDLAGTINGRCSTNDNWAARAAVYVFAGENIVPNDRDGNAGQPQPYATTALFVNLATGEYEYEVLYLPEGDYTAVLACRGDLETPDGDDDLDFRGAQNVAVRAGRTTTRNLAS